MTFPARSRDCRSAFPPAIVSRTALAQGKNIAGTAGYIGSEAARRRDPSVSLPGLRSEPASSISIPPPPIAPTVLAAMRGKVITSGDLIGRYTGK